jgi:selenide,water dikinase
MPQGLLHWCSSAHAGCAAKVPPLELYDLLSNVESAFPSKGVELGMPFYLNDWEDVGAFSLSPAQCVVTNVDMITPIVDDPHEFGQIATAHALSDLYAKSVKPLTAMNILAFPFRRAPLKLAERVLIGIAEQLHRADVVMVGGHTLEDDEMKIGLSIVGICDPNDLVRVSGCKPGDKLMLTKKLGTGIISTALKHHPDQLTSTCVEEAIFSMCQLNDKTSKLLHVWGVNACTDVTGYGLAGHLYNMLRVSRVSATLSLEAIIPFEDVPQLIKQGIFPANLHNNMDFLMLKANSIKLASSALDYSDWRFEILFDPQTSGGLLMSVPPHNLDAMKQALHSMGATFAVIGEVREKKEGETPTIWIES